MPDYPSLDETHDLLLNDQTARFPGGNASRDSPNWKERRTDALAVTSLHAHIDFVGKQASPATATGTGLDAHGKLLGLPRKPDSVAKASAALRVTGVATSALTIGDELFADDGTTYQINETTVIDASGSIDVDIISITKGSSARKQKGEVLTFTSPPPGVNAKAELHLGLDEGGVDVEQDGPYQRRILDRIAFPPAGGRAEDYRQWALEVTGIVAAFVYSGRNGNGAIDIVPTKSGSGAARIPTTAELAAVKAYIDTKRPIGTRDFRVVTPVAAPVDVTFTLQPQDGFEHDWDDSTPLAVAVWTAATRTLQFSTNVPADMQVDDRLIVDSAAADGSESEVESISGVDSVVLKKDPGWAISGADPVYSGGPLVGPARSDIIALEDSMGPARGTTAKLPWVGTLATADLFKTVQLADGVLDSVLVAPVANATPIDTPPNPTTELFVPGKTLVRYL